MAASPDRVVAPATLETPRLVLRRPRPSDAPAVFEYGSDPEVGRYMDWPLLTSVEDAVASTERALRRWESATGFSWRITIKPGDKAVGSVVVAAFITW